MKKINLLFLLFITNAYVAFSQNTSTCDPAINYPGGRMALSFDGNVHDDDDIIALPISMAMIWAAGLKDKMIHVEYNNHVCSHGAENDGSSDFQGDDAGHMRTSANGSISRFGLNGSKFYDYSTKASEATSNFIAAINASSATDRLWIIAAGPMETVWRALNGAQANKRQFVTVLSHSKWNQNHGDCGSNSHNWDDLVRDFSGNGVSFVESCGYSSGSPCTSQQFASANFLADQNISNGEFDFSTSIDKWNWLRDSNDANLKWLFTRNPFGNKFDPSDAGIIYFLITGGPNNGGAKKAGWRETKLLLENPCTINSGGGNETVITDILDLTLTFIDCKSVNLSWTDVSGEEAYRVRRKTATTNYITLVDLPENTTNYVDKTAATNTTYQYMVRPLKGGAAVAISNTPQILIEACIIDPIPVNTFLKAYPSPTEGLLTLPEVFANDQIKVINQQSSKTVLTKTIQISGSTQLDLTNQPAGNYIIQLIRNNQLLTRQITKL